MVVEMLNAAEVCLARPRKARFTSIPLGAGVIGKKTPDGKAIETDEDFVAYLLESEGVAAVHGAAFGLSPYFRASYATGMENLKKACARIQRACAALS